MTDPAAEDIADELLYRTGRALEDDNFDFYKVHFRLPLILESDAGEQVVSTEEDLRFVFEQVQAHLKSNHLNSIVRSVVSAEFLDADTVGATYVTKTFDQDGAPFGQPFPSYSVICRQNTDWKYVRCCLAIVPNSKHRGVFDKILETVEPQGPSGI